MRYVLVCAIGALVATGVFALDVGDPQPGLDGYTIDDSDDYLGPPLDIQDYLDDGKVVVVVHWRQS